MKYKEQNIVKHLIKKNKFLKILRYFINVRENVLNTFEGSIFSIKDVNPEDQEPIALPMALDTPKKIIK